MEEGFIKEKAFQLLYDQLHKRAGELKSSMEDLVKGRENDSKSSAGDKHETAMAMMQIELSNLGQNLHSLEVQIEQVNRIGLKGSTSYVTQGSLVLLENDWLFIIAASTKAIIDGVTINFISPSAPVALLILGKSEGEVVMINSKPRTIKRIL